MKKLLQKLALGATLLATTACTGLSTDKPTFKKGFNAAYMGVHSGREEGYTRVFLGGSYGNDTVRVHYHGLNEVSGSEPKENYFGRNIAGIELGGIGLEAIIDARGNSDGLFEGQPYYGVRDLKRIKLLGADWGFIQGTTNGENSNLTFLYGKNMGFLSPELKRLSIEGFNSYDYRPKEQDSNITEITADWKVNDNFSLFVRQDTKDLQFNDSTYVIGGKLKF